MIELKFETYKYRYLFLFVSFVMLVLGFLNSGNLVFEKYNSTLVMLYFFLSSVFLFLSLKKKKILDILLYSLFISLFLLFISTETQELIENRMIENEKIITNGIITEMDYLYDKKMKTETWFYKYEYYVNNIKYTNKEFIDSEIYKSKDTVEIKYCKSYPRLSKLNEKDANANGKQTVE